MNDRDGYPAPRATKSPEGNQAIRNGVTQPSRLRTLKANCRYQVRTLCGTRARNRTCGFYALGALANLERHRLPMPPAIGVLLLIDLRQQVGNSARELLMQYVSVKRL